MSEAKFTKGPWYVPNANVTKFWSTPLQVVSSSMKRGIVIIDEEGDDHDEEDKANTNLIAAAPEMYDLLVKAKSALLKSYDATEYPANGESECDVVASEIDKLLAKAQGEDSNPSTLQSEKQGN